MTTAPEVSHPYQTRAELAIESARAARVAVLAAALRCEFSHDPDSRGALRHLRGAAGMISAALGRLER